MLRSLIVSFLCTARGHFRTHSLQNGDTRSTSPLSDFAKCDTVQQLSCSYLQAKKQQFFLTGTEVAVLSQYPLQKTG
jgi:hypothetical protein